MARLLSKTELGGEGVLKGPRLPKPIDMPPRLFI